MAAEYVAWENSKVNFEEFLPFFWKQEEPEGCSIGVEWKFGTNCIVVVFESGVASCCEVQCESAIPEQNSHVFSCSNGFKFAQHNLPPYLAHGLRKHFSQIDAPPRTITDTKISHKPDGTSRRFSLVGFKTDKETATTWVTGHLSTWPELGLRLWKE